MTAENLNSEKKFPFVKFRCIKNFANKDNQNGEDKEDEYYLKVDGTHNHTQALLANEKRGHIIVGYGNLEGPKYAEIRSYCDTRLGLGSNQKLYKSVMEERIQKVRDEKQKSKA